MSNIIDAADMQTAMQQGRPWVHREAQNPAYVNVLAIALLFTSLAAGGIVVHAAKLWWLAMIVMLPGVVSFPLVFGGMRVEVSPRGLVVRAGIVGLRLLRVPIDQIVSGEVQAFRPLPEFGGWGYRLGWPRWATPTGRWLVWAFYLRGCVGVKIARSNGRVYLIGSDNPERLMAVIQAARGATGMPTGY